MSEFRKDQVVMVRRSSVEKFQRAWYQEQDTYGDHIVLIDGGSEMLIKDDDIMAQTAHAKLGGAHFVYRDKKGNVTIIPAKSNADFIKGTLKNNFGRELIAMIDLTKFNIVFPEGEGLAPSKYLKGSK